MPQIKQMMNFVKAAKNPQTALMGMAQNNPQMKEAVDLIQKSGGDPKKAFYALAQERGVDPNEILNMMK